MKSKKGRYWFYKNKYKSMKKACYLCMVASLLIAWISLFLVICMWHMFFFAYMLDINMDKAEQLPLGIPKNESIQTVFDMLYILTEDKPASFSIKNYPINETGYDFTNGAVCTLSYAFF